MDIPCKYAPSTSLTTTRARFTRECCRMTPSTPTLPGVSYLKQPGSPLCRGFRIKPVSFDQATALKTEQKYNSGIKWIMEMLRGSGFLSFKVLFAGSSAF
ncbi:hypothetical protein KQX54_007879 [Cotesia glomerata]|uniref:Uncharacterized protein n=1 Tax=Cotesia glomerata TaxID=32391 RepID=A0AAV7IXM6_COTGL|nr:hypothetical protein KQX54_007879 [Cotesia glomerata]